MKIRVCILLFVFFQFINFFIKKRLSLSLSLSDILLHFKNYLSHFVKDIFTF